MYAQRARIFRRRRASAKSRVFRVFSVFRAKSRVFRERKSFSGFSRFLNAPGLVSFFCLRENTIRKMHNRPSRRASVNKKIW